MKKIPKILVVDDDWLFLEVLQIALPETDYESQFFPDGHAALFAANLAAKKGAHFDLLLTDCRMPGMSGQELAREIVHRYPQTKVILMSGLEAEGKDSGEYVGFLKKPFKAAALQSMITSALGKRRGEPVGQE